MKDNFFIKFHKTSIYTITQSDGFPIIQYKIIKVRDSGEGLYAKHLSTTAIKTLSFDVKFFLLYEFFLVRFWKQNFFKVEVFSHEFLHSTNSAEISL